eukprot:24789-Pyramimonas_sp.AAC.1
MGIWAGRLERNVCFQEFRQPAQMSGTKKHRERFERGAWFQAPRQPRRTPDPNQDASRISRTTLVIARPGRPGACPAWGLVEDISSKTSASQSSPAHPRRAPRRVARDDRRRREI